MKAHALLIAFLSFVLLGAGCRAVRPTANPPTANPPAAAAASTTVLVSAEDELKYCNGADMDSDGYRKTIVEEKPVSLPPDETPAARVKSIIVAATTGTCQDVMKQLAITVASGTVHIPPISGWAGVSITMCSCKPQVEVNALRIPGIQKIVWDSAP